MPQLAVAAAGAWLGSAAITGTVLGVSGASIGWAVGSVVGSLLFAPDGPRAELQDTRAAKLQLGAKMPRVYGRARLPMNPRWQSDWRATPQESGGKGGGGSEYFTYSADGLFWVADGTNVITGVRVWHNGKLVWTSLAEASAESIDASAAASLWSAITFHDGNVAQDPWPVYEAAVGTANADAHRRMFCVSIENYQAGTSPNWQFLEVDVITAGTPADFGALTRLQSYFDANDTSDISYYAYGAGTITGTEGAVTGGEVVVNSPTTGGGYFVTYTSSSWGGDGASAVTVECFITLTQVPNVSYTRAFRFWPSLGATDFGFYSDDGSWVYNEAGVGTEYTSPAGEAFGRHHYAVVYSATGRRVYFDGELRYSTGGSSILAGSSTTVQIGGEGYTGLPAAQFSVGSFRVRYEEVYTANFTAPAELDAPDGTSEAWTPATEDLADIVEAECTRCGLTAGQQDHAELVGTEVTGVVFQGSAREACEQLAAAFYFGATCRDDLITRLRGGASVVTVPFSDSGAGVDQAGAPFAGVERGNDLEVPAYWSVSSPNISADYETGTETSDRMVTSSVEVRQVTSLVVFTPAERKGRAQALAVDARVAAHTAEIALADTYAQLEPFDVFTATDEEGNTYRLRAVRETYANGVKTFGVVLDDAAALPTSGATSDTFTPAIVVASPGSVDGILIDGPIARDADDDHGVYYATDLADSATAASLYRSTDDVSYAALVSSTADAVTGFAGTALAGWAGGYLSDEVSTLRVTVSGTLAAVTDAAMIADETVNAFALGVHGRWEYGQFRTPTLVSSGAGLYTYDLTGFLRGRRGSEAAMALHVAGDSFILMRLAGLRRVVMDSGEVGISRYYKHVPAGQLVSSATAEAFTNAGVGRTPYSPVHLEVTRDGSNNCTIAWTRRTRLSTRFASTAGINAPLGEASEAYEVDVYASGAYAAVLRTITASSATASYTAAQQTTDGLTPGDPLFLRIYQLSETIGRGTALEATA